MRVTEKPTVWFRMLAGLMAALIAVSFSPVTNASAVDNEPGPNAVEINDGYVIWGIKYSWRKYTGGTGRELSDGAELMDPVGDEVVGNYKWPIANGYYDPDTKTTVLNLAGQAHYLMYCEPDDPDMCALDSTFRDLRVVISPDDQVIYGTYIGRPQENPGGPKEMYEGVLAKLNVRPVDPVTDGNKTLWDQIPSVAGNQLVLYAEETDIDPVTISYTGPSGKPYMPDKFVDENIPLYENTHRWMPEDSDKLIFFPTEDGERLIVLNPPVIATSYGVEFDQSFDRADFTVLDANTLTPIAAKSFTYPKPADDRGTQSYGPPTFDSKTNTLFFTVNRKSGTRREQLYAARWDDKSEDFVVTQLDDLNSDRDTTPLLVDSAGIFTWDEVNQRLLMSAREWVSDPKLGKKVWKTSMFAYTQEDGQWIKTVQPLSIPAEPPEGVPADEPGSVFSALVGGAHLREAENVWQDGHIIVASDYTYYAGDPKKRYGYPLFDVWEEADGSWKSRFIPDSRPIDTSSLADPNEPDSRTYNSLLTSVDGGIFAGEFAQVPTLTYFDNILGVPQRTEVKPNKLTSVNKLTAVATDPALAYDLVYSIMLDTVYVLKDREVLSTFKVGRTPWADHFKVGKPGTFYMSVQSAWDAPVGIERFEIAAMSPAVTKQPLSQQIDLVDGMRSATASFSVDYTAVGETTIQWQERPVGAEYFTDIEGANAPTLTVDADLSKNGTLYRAKLINPAGNVKSNDAQLMVRSAPRFLDQPVDMSGGEGDKVTFTAPADPSIPADEQVWQMLVGQEWQDVAASEDIIIEGDKLTVTVSEEIDGAVFRSVLRNAVGASISDEAILTMVPATEAPMISEHPSSQEVEVGASVTFTAAATGIPAPSVQWQERIAEGQWRDIAGATEPALLIDGVELAQSGVEYRAVFANEAGQVASEPAVLTVIDPTPPPEPKPEPEPEPEPEPSVEPTAEPTVDPTMDPTMEPTMDPTTEPSGDPTVVPSSDSTPDRKDPAATVSGQPNKPSTDSSQHYGKDGMPHTGAAVWSLMLVAAGLIGLGVLLVLRRRYR